MASGTSSADLKKKLDALGEEVELAPTLTQGPGTPMRKSGGLGGKNDDTKELAAVQKEIPSATLPQDQPAPTKVIRKTTGRKPAARSQTSTGSKTQRTIVSELIAAAEKIQVYHRATNGKLSFVGRYTTEDLRNEGAIEPFLKRYIVPDYGYGEFNVKLQKSNGETIFETGIDIKAPLETPRRGNGGGPSHFAMGSGGGSHDDNAVRILERSMSAMQAISDRDRERADEANRQILEAAAKGNDGLTTMLPLLLSMQQQRGPDPNAEMLRELVMERVKEAAAPPPQPIPLPPPPPPGPSITEMMSAMATMMQSMAPQRDQGLSQAEMMKMVLEQQSQSRMGPSEIITLITTALPAIKEVMGVTQLQEMMKENLTKTGPGGDLHQALDNIMALRDVQGALLGDAGQGENFWTVLGKLAENLPESAAAFSTVLGEVGSKAHSAPAGMLPAPSPQAQAQQPQQQRGEFPQQVRDTLKLLNNTDQEPEQVVNILSQAIQMLEGTREWQPYVIKMLAAAKSGEVAIVLNFCLQFLQSANQLGAITRDGMNYAAGVVATNIEAIVLAMNGGDTEEAPEEEEPEAPEEPSEKEE